MGVFQEFFQVEVCRLYIKFFVCLSSIEVVFFVIEKVVRSSIYGCLGVCYVDILVDFVNFQVNVNFIKYVECCMLFFISMVEIFVVCMVVFVIKNVRQFFFIIGKGVVYVYVEESIQKLVE